jgi:hypothetical protein
MRKSCLLFLFSLFIFSKVFAANIIEWSNPIYTELGGYINIYANISGINITNVSVNISTPFYENFTYSMGGLGNNTYYYNYSIPLNESYYGTYSYFVHCLEEGNLSISNTSYFFVINAVKLKENITISVQIVPTCMANIVRFVPFDVQKTYFQNQSLPILVYFENSGNIVLTDKSFEIRIENITNEIIWSVSGEGYPEGNIEPGEIGFYWNFWDTDLTPLGNYTAIATVNYESFMSGEQVMISFSILNATTNCTDEGEYWICISEKESCGENILESEYPINTTTLSNTTISNIKNGTVGYEGVGEINGSNYRAFSFILDSCESYCYACLSDNLTASSVNLTSDDCGFLDDKIENYNFFVESIESNGSSIYFGIRNPRCKTIKTTYNCTILENNITANCSQTVECVGYVERIEEFEIINFTGNLPTPEPEPTPTPEPEPTPTPEPEPTPTPEPEPEKAEIAINIEPLNRSIIGEQSVWIPSIFNITNIGNVNVTNITLVPIVPNDWQKQDALISFLETDKSVNRTIFILPSYTAFGQYVIPVKAIGENVTLDIDYFWVTIIEGANRTKLEIIEIPREIGVYIDSEISFPILIKNTGKVPLNDIRLRLENLEQCVDYYNYSKIYMLNESSTGSILVSLKTKKIPATCNTTVIIWSKEGVYAFAPLTIFTTPIIRSPPIPLLPLLAFILISIEMILIHYKKSKESKDEESTLTNMALYLVFIILLIVMIIIILQSVNFLQISFLRNN